MKLGRRDFLRLTAGAAALPASLSTAWAQAYPTRPVRWAVGFAAGSAPDIIARLMAQWLSARFNQQFIVENRPGGGSIVATETVVKARPDGQTLLLVGSHNAIGATLYDNLSFNFMRDIAAVSAIARYPMVMEVDPSFPAKSVPEFIAQATANPGKINMAASANGSTVHVASELFKMMAGIDTVRVPYRGNTEALHDLFGGHVQVVFDAMPLSIEHIRAGKVRALAVTTASRSQLLPDVPALGEFLPGYEASIWMGMGAPGNTPADIVASLNKEIDAGLADAKIKSQLANLGAEGFPGSAADFASFIAEETEKWAKVVRSSGAKPD
jgi:tripartite-type tricarboxylate transporter receptor subunit TctC